MLDEAKKERIKQSQFVTLFEKHFGPVKYDVLTKIMKAANQIEGKG